MTRPPELLRESSVVGTTLELKVTTLPAGITTFATFCPSGNAPPYQLEACDQLPVAPPTHVTEPSWVMSAVAVAVVLVRL
jgi:hypothetical protein